jgi:glycosyltransferase involved in cell wall biosynthesis
MKVEIIIAHKDELPQNLHWTYYAMRATGVDVRLVEDIDGNGPGYTRHQGIERSEADIVVLCDAHMQLSAETIPAIVKHLRRNPKHLVVPRMQSLGRDWKPIDDAIYAGADLQELVTAPSKQHWPLAARWRRKDTGNGQIGCVMGACYGIRRNWYYEIGQPLSILRAWGMDEELLSICTWMRGGQVRLIDGLAQHVYAAPKTGNGLTHRQKVEVWANRLAALSAIPMSKQMQSKYRDWLIRTPFVRSAADQINDAADSRSAEIERMHEALADGDFAKFRKRWIKPATETSDLEKIAAADATRRQSVGDQSRPRRRRYIIAPVVTDEGVPCPHCGYRYNHRVTHTWPNGHRRVECGGCTYPFTMRRKEDPTKKD